MCLQETGYEEEGKIYMAQNKIECLGFLSLVISLPLSDRMVIFEVA
jgi:hypothetical protein